MTSDLDLPDLVIAYQRLVLWFAAQLLFPGFAVVALLAGEGAAVSLASVVFMGQLVILVGLAIYGYRTAVALGSDAGWVWAVALVVPVINIVALLLLSSKATRACRANGVPVGFLGPKTQADR